SSTLASPIRLGSSRLPPASTPRAEIPARTSGRMLNCAAAGAVTSITIPRANKIERIGQSSAIPHPAHHGADPQDLPQIAMNRTLTLAIPSAATDIEAPDQTIRVAH